MNKIARITTVAGMGALAALAISAGPAQAASAAPQTAAKTAASQHHDRYQVVGYYRNAQSCLLAGRIGERFGRWDRYGCSPIRVGFHRGAWVLTAAVSDRGGWGHQGHDWDNQGHGWGNGHGQDGHGHDGHGQGNGHDGNGHDGNGHDGNGHDGNGHDGNGHDGHDGNGHGLRR